MGKKYTRMNQIQPDPSSRWMKLPEAAAYARVTLSKIRKWIADGVLPVVVTKNKQNLSGKGGAGYVLDRLEIDRLMEHLTIRMKHSSSPRASCQTGPRRAVGRDVSKPAQQPAQNGPCATPNRGTRHHPDEPD